MTERIVVRCRGACEQEVNAAEVDNFGWCTLCQIMDKVKSDYEGYKRLWAKNGRLEKAGHPHAACEEQLRRVVGRIARACHAKLPLNGAAKLVNEICERARSEIEGFDRILTVAQARSGQRKPADEKPGDRRTASGIYLA